MSERQMNAARAEEQLLEGKITMLVDTMDNTVTELYTGKPTRIYLIDKSGKVVFNQGTGPYHFNMDGLAEVLKKRYK